MKCKCRAAWPVRLVLFGVLIASQSEVTLAMAKDQRPLVATSFSVLEDIAIQIAGPSFRVVSLIQNSQNIHGRDLTSKNVQTINEADLLIINGSGFEPWSDRLLAENQRVRQKTLILLPTSEALRDPIGNLDPHAWNDPSRGILYGEKIRQALAKQWPLEESQFRKREGLFAESLQKILSDFRKIFTGIPLEKRVGATSHNAFQYLGQSFGLKFSSVQGLSVEDSLTPKSLAKIRDAIVAQKIHFLFTDDFSEKTIRQFALDNKLEVMQGVRFDNLGIVGQGRRESYQEMLGHNLKILQSALAPDSLAPKSH